MQPVADGRGQEIQAVPVPPAEAASLNDQPADPVKPFTVNAVFRCDASSTDGVTWLTYV